MSAGFDPYYKLLGIPPEEQPPDHYRLLGVPRKYEDDVEVIENCSNRLILSLRQHQSGVHGPIISKVLNEVSAARRTLLNPEKKQAYDDELRAAEANPINGADILATLGEWKVLFISVAAVVVLGLGAIGLNSLIVSKGPQKEKLTEKPIVANSSLEITGIADTPKPNMAESNVAISEGAVALVYEKPTRIRIRKPAIPLPPSQAGSKTQNLIPQVDPAKDGTEQDWVKEGYTVASTSSRESVLVLPFDSLPPGIHLELGVERIEDGPGEFYIQLPTSVKPALFGFDIGSPTRSGVFVDSDNLEFAPRTQVTSVFQTGGPKHFLITASTVACNILDGRPGSFYGWGGDARRFHKGPLNESIPPNRIVIVTKGARFRIHSVTIGRMPESSLPKPKPADQTDLISTILTSRDVMRGDWGYAKPIIAPMTPYGVLLLPVDVPEQYDLSVLVEIPDDRSEVVIGLRLPDRTIPVYLNPKVCSFGGPGVSPLKGGTFPTQTPVQFDFQVRKDAISISKGGSLIAKEAASRLARIGPAEFTLPWQTPEEKQRIFFATTTSSYKLVGIGMAENSGTDVKSSIKSK
jgi:hypothetical protein